MAARAKKNFWKSDLLTPLAQECSIEIWSTRTYTEFDCAALLAMFHLEKENFSLNILETR